MACGVHLGILLICLVQAEHVRCLWATQAQRPNSNTYVGFTQQGSGFGGSYPQNQLRQASGSAQSSSLNTDPIGSDSSQRFPNSGYTQTLFQPANSGYDSVKLVQSSAQSKPNWRTTKLNWEHLQKMPKKRIFGLSASIAGGRSLSKYDQTPISKKRTLPVQQGTPSKSNHRSSSSESFQGPRESYSFKPYSHQTAAQKALVNSETAAYTGLMGSTMKSSRPSSGGAAEPRRIPVRTKTSASAPARRVSSLRGSAVSKPSRFSSLQNERTRNNPSQTEAWEPYSSKVVPVNARNLPASGTSSVGTSGQGFASSTIHQIPQSFGGFAIRRLKIPVDQKEVSVVKLQQQAYVAPRRPFLLQAYVAPRRPSLLQQAYVAPRRPSLLQQAYVAPRRPSLQQQANVGPQRPSLQHAYAAPRHPSLQQQVNVAPRHPSLQQAYAAPRHQSLQLQQAYIAPQRPSLQQQAYVTSKLPLQLKSQRSRLFIQKPNGRWSGHTSDNKI
ncbi:uncharacterized protein LOC117739189 [Cyclopterus lumpus]|uniref:uncharacterized protein LOC117739189 n=1 Tax=Cyclopterus lumpus TaxID=8103 RepID=UPI0014870E25|nr:uncharacterized protein LOC117739189 [Cyclopterus lumpus]